MAEFEFPVNAPWKSPRWIAISIALSVCVAVGFVGSVSWVFHRNRLATDFFQFLFTASTVGWLLLIAAKMWLKSRPGSGEAPIYRRTTYSFPRRFGMSTLLVLTLAFGVLTAFCRWLEWREEIVLGILVFFGLISAAQFACNRAPREASVLVGSIVLAGCVIAWRVFNTQRQFWFTQLDVSFFAAAAALLGGVVGYCAGTLVGSIFMFMAGANAVLKKPEQQSDHA